MAITVEGTPTTAKGDSTTFSVAVPSVGVTIAAGDYIVVVAKHDESEDNAWGVPTGMDGEWLAELQVGQVPPSIPGVQVFYELCSGGESGTRSSVGTFAGSWDVICFVLRGVDGTTPLDVTPTTVQSTSTGDPDPPAITPSSNDCAIIAIGIKDQAVTTAQTVTTWPTNYTALQQFSNSNTTTGGILAVAIRVLTGGGGSSENPSAYVMSLGVDEWAAATLAVRPGATSTLEQEGYRWYGDGTESGSAPRQNQDTADSVTRGTTVQCRVLVNATGDPPSQQYRLEYKETADADVEYRPVPLT